MNRQILLTCALYHLKNKNIAQHLYSKDFLSTINLILILYSMDWRHIILTNSIQMYVISDTLV